MAGRLLAWAALWLLAGDSLGFDPTSPVERKIPSQTLFDAGAVAWAINVGGPAHLSADGVAFQADDTSGGVRGSVAAVLGTQDEVVYRTYRVGNLVLEQAVQDGIYDLTLLFAEPHALPGGERVFDVLAQGEIVIDGLDVSLSRSSTSPSALKRTVSDIEVIGGKFRLELRGRESEPVLSGLVLRAKEADTNRWRLLWSDEFDYEGRPDPARWHVERWPARKVNDEDQAYTDRAKNVRVSDGKLILEAHREDYEGALYTSGRVHTRGLGDFLYGRLDIRARLPVGQGTWSALWMLPSDPYRYATTCSNGVEWQGNPACDAWPNSGEIDIMEHVGYDMTRVHSTVHGKLYFASGPQLRNAAIEVPDVAGRFHVYTLEWTPQRIRVFVDGVPYYEYLNEGRGWGEWPFDHPFHLIMNLAVGGFWGRAGGPIDPRVFPASMEVDYVRVFEPVPAE